MDKENIILDSEEAFTLVCLSKALSKYKTDIAKIIADECADDDFASYSIDILDNAVKQLDAWF